MVELFAALPVPIPDGAEPPSEFRIWKWGENATLKGPVHLDKASAEQVLKAFQDHGIDAIAIDYEHQTFAAEENGKPAPAAGWFVPEVRDDGLWATQVKWTDTAADHLRRREYRFFSPTALLDSKTRKPVRLQPMALTNYPATKGLVPLAASLVGVVEGVDSSEPVSVSLALGAEGTTAQEDNMADKTLLIALGLKADTDDTEALTQATKLRDFEREVLQLSGKQDRAEALGVLRAHSHAQEQLTALTAQLKQMQSAARSAEFDALLAQGQTDEKLTPAMLKSDWITKLRDREDGVEQLTAFLAAAPKQMSSGTGDGNQPRRRSGDVIDATGVKFTAAEREMARLLHPHNTKDVLERIAKFRAAGGRVNFGRPADDEGEEEATA
jgi:phage I-like protein